MDKEIILKKLTLKEKASLCSGAGMWTTKGIKRLGIPSVMMTDGPHGLRKEEKSKNIGLNNSIPATCFPPACTLASGWNRELLYEVGAAIGEEALANGVSMVLGPAVNIKRSPLCGRNFEYFSEDPYLAGQLAAEYIKGMQQRGAGAVIKHYAVNSQETLRQTADARVEERALRQIYLAAFETAVKTARPWAVMCSYNKVNGEYLSDSKKLLTDILRDEWGFDGAVITDWGAMNDRIKAIKAGCDLEMPANRVNDRQIVRAVKKGELKEEELDACVLRVLALAEKCGRGGSADMEKNHRLAQKAAAEGSVLLKNSGALPFDKNKPLLVIGEFARIPRYQGSGSSKIVPSRLISFLEVLEERNISYTYEKGYSVNSSAPDKELIKQAANAAISAPQVLVMAGLTSDIESEAFDRPNMNMSAAHNELISAVIGACPNAAVHISAGSPVVMPWADKAGTVMYGYLGGQAGAEAMADVLFGDTAPSGKLAETFVVKEEDCPVRITEDEYVEYAESIFTGYRYYSTANIKPLFPFGHGLSYTSFEYSGIVTDGKSVCFDIKNTGDTDAKEVAQLYIRKKGGRVLCPDIELKGFEKVMIPAGRTVSVKIPLEDSMFMYFNTAQKRMCIENGEYELLIGSSSEDIRLATSVVIDNNEDIPDGRYYEREDIGAFPFEKIYGAYVRNGTKEVTDRTRLNEIKDTPIGRLFYKIAASAIKCEDELQAEVMRKAAADIPLGSMFNMSPVPIPMWARKFIISLAARGMKKIKKQRR